MGKAIKYPNLVVEMAKRGDTQNTLAKLLKLNQPSISLKLRGKVRWSVEEVDKICEYYNKDYKQLFK